MERWKDAGPCCDRVPQGPADQRPSTMQADARLAGPAKAEAERWRRPAAPLGGAALIMYGLIRQWVCSEGEGERGEAGDDGVCSGVGEGVEFAGCVGVADAVGSGLAGGVDVGDLVADEGAGGWVGMGGGDGLVEQVGAGFEQAGVWAGPRDDGCDGAVEGVAGEVGADGAF